VAELALNCNSSRAQHKTLSSGTAQTYIPGWGTSSQPGISSPFQIPHESLRYASNFIFYYGDMCCSSSLDKCTYNEWEDVICIIVSYQWLTHQWNRVRLCTSLNQAYITEQ
jgi:hypothetical protein